MDGSIQSFLPVSIILHLALTAFWTSSIRLHLLSLFQWKCSPPQFFLFNFSRSCILREDNQCSQLPKSNIRMLRPLLLCRCCQIGRNFLSIQTPNYLSKLSFPFQYFLYDFISIFIFFKLYYLLWWFLTHTPVPNPAFRNEFSHCQTECF